MSNDEIIKRFSDGDMDALIHILEGERSALYDYLVRMTGEMERSYDSMEEVLRAIYHHADRYNDYSRIRVDIYKTARSFNRDIWNADTSQLEILLPEASVYVKEEVTNIPGECGKTIEPKVAHREIIEDEVHRVVRQHPPKQREILLLYHRYGFSLREMGDIFGCLHADMVTELLAAEQAFKNSWKSSGELSKLIKNMVYHPLPKEDHTTVALSELIKGVERKKWNISGVVRQMVFAVLIFLTVIFAVFYLLPFILELIF